MAFHFEETSAKLSGTPCFVARQKRIHIEGDDFFVDLVFYNRLLQCFVIFEIKTHKLTHQDIGQLQMYVNYYDRVEKQKFENPTIGVLLCANKNDAVVKFTLPQDNKSILASKYTEVGFVGRDVESMVRDLVTASINLVKAEHREKNESQIQDYVEKKIIEKLLPPLPKSASAEKQDDYKKSFERMKNKLKNGELDELKIEVDISKGFSVDGDSNLPPEVIKVQESFVKILGQSSEKIKKEVNVKEARNILKTEASEKLLDMDVIKDQALKRAENNGIIFIDEIDKVAVSSGSSNRQDPSKEGVQRDLLPIVEGSDISTKHGVIKTDHILFISAGAFHLSKPSDLIPELQGRFPIRVELSSLDEEVLYKILTQPKNSLPKQYQALLSVEDVELIFEEEALKTIAKLSARANEKAEDIGARRLHTVIENILDDISYEASDKKGETITVTKELVHEKLDEVIEDQDLSKYIL
jgi:ATP-dependent HslUV protease ATP-binding subunit HslU